MGPVPEVQQPTLPGSEAARQGVALGQEWEGLPSWVGLTWLEEFKARCCPAP